MLKKLQRLKKELPFTSGASVASVASGAALLTLSFVYALQCARRGNDFVTMWGACRLVLEGGELYSRVILPGANGMIWRNPPAFTFLTAPLGLLPVRWAAVLWFYAKLGLLGWVVSLLKRLSEGWKPLRGALWVPLLMTATWINDDLTIGHMNLAAAALTLGALLCFLLKKNRAAALSGSLAIVSKGPAALLLVFYAVRKETRLLLSTALLALGWTVLPMLVWGPSRTIRYNREFAQSLRFDAIYADVDNGWAENWGLPEMVMRATGQALPDNRYGRSLEIVHLPYAVSKACSFGLAGAGVLLLALWWWRKRDERGLDRGFGSPLLHHAGLAATAILVFSPVTRKAYFGTLLLPYFILWNYLRSEKEKDRTVASLFGLSLFFSLFVQTDIWGRPFAFFWERRHALSFSLFSLFAAQVLAAIAAERKGTERTERTES